MLRSRAEGVMLLRIDSFVALMLVGVVRGYGLKG